MSLAHWAKHWLPLLAISSGFATAAPSTSQGPATAEEAAVLLEQGQEAYSQKADSECIRLLQRLIDRHAGSPGHLRAHLLVGECYLRKGEFESAELSLKHFVESTGLTSDGVRGRLLLDRARIAQKEFSEALLLSNELLNRTLEPHAKLEALVLKAQALFGLNQDLRAAQSLAVFQKESAEFGQLSPLKEEAFWVEQRLKLRACAQIQKGGTLDEGTVRTQFRARGLCLREALVLLKRTVQDLSSQEFLQKAGEDGVMSLVTYRAFVDSKLPEPKKLSAKQAKQYQKELREALLADFSEFQARTREFLAEWKRSSPGAVALYIEPIEKALR